MIFINIAGYRVFCLVYAVIINGVSYSQPSLQVSNYSNIKHVISVDKALKNIPESETGKVVAYTSAQWKKITRHLYCAELTPDNNAAERSIKPFVIGRKSRPFSGSPGGAIVSFYSTFTIIYPISSNQSITSEISCSI